ncbi:hypothetical protein LW858_29160 (plasmid) [Bacillus cereus]|uniref:Uncharacterized protein n=1 Tax=Bacillus cereus TaxID=1396 RepID=A0A9X6B2X7_BACCE|nr:hypothetical protein [Bacillus cereus]OOR71187.1 hypothetical protein BLX06_32170 [Bacillus cereus]UIJ69663.1 hypothetical protein LW858_29160 [Bacillus cereus]
MRKKMESIPLSFLSNQCIYQRNKWNRDKIIKKLQMLYKQRADISDSALQKKHTDLYSAIFRIFGKGGHRKAILEANLPYKHIRKKVACRNWDEEFIIQSLQVLYKLEVDISSSNLKKNYNNLYEEIRKLFKNRGGHRAAVELSGIDYLLVRKKTGPKF